MAIQKFTATLSKEGSTGSVRGKIPAAMVTALGGDHGDVVEFEIDRKAIVAGHILSSKEAARVKANRQYFGREQGQAKPVKAAPAVKAPVKGKANGKAKRSVGNFTLAQPKKKVVAQPAKSNKRKTVVAMKPVKKQAQKSKVQPRFSI